MTVRHCAWRAGGFIPPVRAARPSAGINPAARCCLNQEPAGINPAVGRPVRALLKFCGSLRLAIVLMAVLVGVLIPATCVENWYGPAAARFFIYGTAWFAALAVLLAVNVLAALVLRFPWKRRQTGFVLTHVGLLVLLLGCLLTRRRGIDAVVPIFEGQAARIASEDPRISGSPPTRPRPVPPSACPSSQGRSVGTTIRGCWGSCAITGSSTTAAASAWKAHRLSSRAASRGPTRARVRLTVDGTAEEFWIAPTPSEPFEKPPENARQVVAGKGRKVALTLRRDEVDLGVQVFRRSSAASWNPGPARPPTIPA